MKKLESGDALVNCVLERLAKITEVFVHVEPEEELLDYSLKR
jgi:hypothetical protein